MKPLINAVIIKGKLTQAVKTERIKRGKSASVPILLVKKARAK